ncbi:MAG: hypothetical protein ACREGC_02200, partial [Minisyncoccia bacterium]
TWKPIGVLDIKTGNNVLIENGNVGVGSLVPGQLVDVQGTVRALYFVGDGSGVSGTISGLTTGTIPQASSATSLSNSVITQSSGNIGVGVAVPSAPLEVNGPIIADGSGSSYFSSGNLGIGTTTPQTAFAVTDGNVGIGTWTADGGNLIVKGRGNVGIGSAWPGQVLDVQGTVRTTGFAMSGQTPVSGYVLTASDSAGDTTWTAAGAVSGWTSGAGVLYTTTATNNVGIGTFTPVAQLAIAGNGVGIGTNMNSTYLKTTPPIGGMIVQGNVGIGTYNPSAIFEVGNQGFDVTSTGNVGIGTKTPSGALEIEGGANAGIGIGTALTTTSALTVMNGNVGIGTWVPAGKFDVAGASSTAIFGGNVGIGSLIPGQKLDVQGTTRMTGFNLTGNGAANGSLMISNAVGVGTWMAASTLPLATVLNQTAGDVTFYNATNTLTGGSGFQTNGTNVGIGTSGFTTASLQVVG